MKYKMTKDIKRIFKGAGMILPLGLLAFSLNSCNDYLDKEYDASQSDEKVFGDETMTRGFLADLYNYAPNGLSIFNDDQRTASSRDCMTDNAICFWGLHYYTFVANDAYTSTNHALTGFWGTDTKSARACSQFIANANPTVIGNKVISGSDDSRLYDRNIQEATLLRALAHLDLVAWFGDAPIIDHVLTTSEASAMTRTPAGDVLQWVADECDRVVNSGYLPMRYQNETSNWGRVNGCMAYAMKSRALLYKASPLNLAKTNNAVSAQDAWKAAADAADEAIQKCQENGYKLNGTEGSYDTSAEGDYYKVFASDPTQSNEIIFGSQVMFNTQVEKMLMPFGFKGSSFQSAGRTNPTQNFVDSYETINGLAIDQDLDYDEQNPYANRDPRLDQTIFHQGSRFGDVGTTVGRNVDVREDGGEDLGSAGEAGGTHTGYYLKKWCYNIDINNASNMPHSWILFRFAELLLNSAEAHFNLYLLNGSASDLNTALTNINKVRARAGMPAYTAETLTLERLQNERRVELCFEDHRFFDQRRWMLFEGVTRSAEVTKPRYQQMLNIYGVQVGGTAAAPTYVYARSKANDTRTFVSPKSYLFPIPYTETKAAPGLGQNPGW